MERIRIAVAVFALLVIALVVRSVRREHIRVEYSMAWLGAAVLLLILCLWDRALDALGRIIGVQGSAVALIAIAGVLFAFTFFRYSIVVSSLKDHNIQLAQKVGMLEWEIERLNKKVEAASGGRPDSPAAKDEGGG